MYFYKQMWTQKYCFKKEKAKQSPELNYGMTIKKRAPSLLYLDSVLIQIQKKQQNWVSTLILHQCGQDRSNL